MRSPGPDPILARPLKSPLIGGQVPCLIGTISTRLESQSAAKDLTNAFDFGSAK